MFFSVIDLEVRKIPFDVSFPAGEIDFLDPLLHQKGMLKADGVAELLSETLGEICLRGHISMEMATPCDRCLEPASFPIDSDFELHYLPSRLEPTGDEVELRDGETEIGFYEGDGLQLEEALREFVLLALPMQLVCRPDCKGICPECGQNRNETACDCRPRTADDRWAALKELID